MIHDHTVPISYQLAYRKIPRISTSLTEASTMGILTSGAPRPTRTRTPPERVAWNSGGKSRNPSFISLYTAVFPQHQWLLAFLNTHINSLNFSRLKNFHGFRRGQTTAVKFSPAKFRGQNIDTWSSWKLEHENFINEKIVSRNWQNCKYFIP